MDSVINWNILGNPVNWVIVTLILIFVAYSFYVLHNNLGSLLPTIAV